MNALILTLIFVPGGSTTATFDCTDALPRVMGQDFEAVARTCEIVACPTELNAHLGTWRGAREEISSDDQVESRPHELGYLYCVASDLEPTVYLYGLEGRPGGAKVAVARSEASRQRSFDHPVWGTNTPGCEPPNLYRERHERISTSPVGMTLDVEVRLSLWRSSADKRVVHRERLVKVDDPK